MALFKFRLPGQGEAAPEGRRRAGATNVRKSQAAPTESVESLRQRARHRVIGATVLVVAAVIGFPMLFDSEPRPVDVNVPIAIPDRDNAPPLHADAGRAERVDAQDSLNDHEEVVTNEPAPAVVPPPVRGSTSSAARSVVSPEVSAQAERDRAEQAAKDKAEQERAAKAAHEREAREKAAKEKAAKERAAKEKAAKEKAAKERAEKAEKDKVERAERADRLAQDKAEREKREKAAKDKADRLAREKAEKADKDKADTGRFVVQVGSFGEESKAREARSKLERAGITTYIQVIETSEGKRTRVRVGPFGSRSEAEAVAKKVKALGLYSGIAEL